MRFHESCITDPPIRFPSSVYRLLGFSPECVLLGAGYFDEALPLSIIQHSALKYATHTSLVVDVKFHVHYSSLPIRSSYLSESSAFPDSRMSFTAWLRSARA